jgi:hypothetical protein
MNVESPINCGRAVFDWFCVFVRHRVRCNRRVTSSSEGFSQEGTEDTEKTEVKNWTRMNADVTDGHGFDPRSLPFLRRLLVVASFSQFTLAFFRDIRPMYASTHHATTGRGPISTKKFEDFLGIFCREFGEAHEWRLDRVDGRRGNCLCPVEVVASVISQARFIRLACEFYDDYSAFANCLGRMPGRSAAKRR